MRLMKIYRNDFDHYEYTLLYVNALVAIGDNPTEVLQNNDKYFVLKTGSLDNLRIYLAKKVNLMRMENGVVAWSLRIYPGRREEYREIC